MNRLAVALLLLLAVPSAVLARGLSAAEQGLVATIDSRRDQALELLRQLVDINSGTLNHDGVREVGRIIGAALAGLGFETTWIDGSGFDRAGHVVATRPGDGPHVLLIGHLDTVFEPDSPFQRFELVGEHDARGPGVIDMKGGLVVMLEALHALAAADALNDLQLTAVITGDEERPARPLSESRRVLIEAGEAADFALGFEDGDGNPGTAVIARRGSTKWRLDVTGAPAHSSQIFSEAVGAGAIYETARILEGFRERLAAEKDLTYNPGLVLAGTSVDFDPDQARGSAFGKPNVVPERAVTTGDLRATSPEQLTRAKATMQEVVGQNLPRTEATLIVDDAYPPMGPTDGNRRLLGLYDQASRDLGLGPVEAVDPRNAGAADVSVVAADVEMALDGLGLMGAGGHTVDETADLRTLSSQAHRVAVLLWRLARGALD